MKRTITGWAVAGLPEWILRTFSSVRTKLPAALLFLLAATAVPPASAAERWQFHTCGFDLGTGLRYGTVELRTESNAYPILVYVQLYPQARRLAIFTVQHTSLDRFSPFAVRYSVDEATPFSVKADGASCRLTQGGWVRCIHDFDNSTGDRVISAFAKGSRLHIEAIGAGEWNQNFSLSGFAPALERAKACLR